jgi:hypothetical protein
LASAVTWKLPIASSATYPVADGAASPWHRTKLADGVADPLNRPRKDKAVKHDFGLTCIKSGQ